MREFPHAGVVSPRVMTYSRPKCSKSSGQKETGMWRLLEAARQGSSELIGLCVGLLAAAGPPGGGAGRI